MPNSRNRNFRGSRNRRFNNNVSVEPVSVLSFSDITLVKEGSGSTLMSSLNLSKGYIRLSSIGADGLQAFETSSTAGVYPYHIYVDGQKFRAARAGYFKVKPPKTSKAGL
jgi:hypothetical protein